MPGYGTYVLQERQDDKALIETQAQRIEQLEQRLAQLSLTTAIVVAWVDRIGRRLQPDLDYKGQELRDQLDIVVRDIRRSVGIASDVDSRTTGR